MGRRSKSQTLALWANGERVGRWTVTARGDMELQYDAAWLASPSARPLSLSLPFNFDNEPLKGSKVGNYFENLLPDSDAIRRRVAARFRTGSTEAFDLLGAIGRDCVGALQLLEDGQQPTGVDRVEGVEVDEQAVRAPPARGRLPGPVPRRSAYPVIGDARNQWAGRDVKLAIALLGKNRHYHGPRHPVQAELPWGFSQEVADKVLGRLLAAAPELGAMAGD